MRSRMMWAPELVSEFQEPGSESELHGYDNGANPVNAFELALITNSAINSFAAQSH